MIFTKVRVQFSSWETWNENKTMCKKCFRKWEICCLTWILSTRTGVFCILLKIAKENGRFPWICIENLYLKGHTKKFRRFGRINFSFCGHFLSTVLVSMQIRAAWTPSQSPSPSTASENPLKPNQISHPKNYKWTQIEWKIAFKAMDA